MNYPSSAHLPEPGFYMDSQGDKRWWDGESWTHVALPKRFGTYWGEGDPTAWLVIGIVGGVAYLAFMTFALLFIFADGLWGFLFGILALPLIAVMLTVFFYNAHVGFRIRRELVDLAIRQYGTD